MTTTRAPRPGSIRILYKLALLDKIQGNSRDHEGHTVEVTQPFGCPRNGTMGMCYVDCVTCGAEKAKLLDIDPAKSRIFIGLVCLGSMYKPNEPVQVLGPAANGKHHVRCADGSERVTATVPEYLLSN